MTVCTTAAVIALLMLPHTPLSAVSSLLWPRVGQCVNWPHKKGRS